ncbi:hypothetical protein DFH09DRAFT_1362718 [Mycena vulgaris]|nr:hypothetical protein DFH09DRAFT_1366217 [Mycena vulgaris]KAJ6570043.1 hypothetical protein DFH09DRAFT_1362718 [Mycena vulgaris]
MPHLSTAIIPRDLVLSGNSFGCTADADANATMGTNQTITQCCEEVGSTAGIFNGSFGCPYNTAWNDSLPAVHKLMRCVEKLNASGLEAVNPGSFRAFMPGLRRSYLPVGIFATYTQIYPGCG